MDSVPEVGIEELGTPISQALSLSEERTDRFIKAFLQIVRSSIAAGKEVVLSKLGKLTLVDKNRNPLPAMYSANLHGDICGKLHETNDDLITSLIAALIGEVQKSLLEGKKVVFDEVGTLEIRRERPKIERQPKGHRLIKPAATRFRFESQGPVITPAGEGELVFEPAPDFKKKIDQFRESTIMLVVPERDFFVKTLEYYFENAGWDIEAYTDVSEAKRKLKSGGAYLVVVDAGMSEYQSLVGELKFSKDLNVVPLVILFPNEEAFSRVKEITVMGDENLAQPFEFRKLLDCADSEILRAAEEGLIFAQQLNIHLPTDEQLIEKLIEQGQKLMEGSGLNEEAQVAMSAAFREAVINAAQHGNRYKRDRKIEIQYLLDREKVTMVIRDQGPGFNHEAYVQSRETGSAVAAARERHAQGKMGGLGILLMLRCCDRLEYNQRGNQITLTKFLAPKE